MRLQRCALAGALAGVLALCAHAASAAETGFYFGLTVGQADYEFEPPPPIPQVDPLPFPLQRPGLDALPPVFGVIGEPAFVIASNALSSFTPLFWAPGGDDSDTAWGALVGYRAARHVAVELSYLNLGTLKASETLLIPPILGGGSNTYRRELETSGPALSALGILPITEQWEVYLRAGVLFADMKLSSSVSGRFGGASGSTTFGSQDALWGAGTQFNWGDHWSVRLDFQRFEGVGSDSPQEADIDLLSLGILYRL